MTRARPLLAVGAFLLGLTLLAFAVIHADLRSIGLLVWQLGAALPLAMVPGAAWHLLRTIAWHECFPSAERPTFGRTFRVRLAAEAFSFVTIRGVAGEPLKVVLLEPDVTPAVSAAAVALERMAYLTVTAAILGVSALTAMVTLPLSATWVRIFGIIAVTALSMVALVIFLLLRARSSRPASRRFAQVIKEQVRALVQTDRRRLARLALYEAGAYLMMAVEVWVVLWVTSTPVGLAGAIAIETFTRAASVASAFIPGNVGALEASNVAAAVALQAGAGAAALALVRRVRGLIWCLLGFLIYPRVRLKPEPTKRSNGSTTDTLIVLEDARSDVLVSDQLGGMTIGERTLRAARRAGYSHVLVWAPRQRPSWDALARWMRASMQVIACSDAARWWGFVRRLDAGAPVTVVAPGFFAPPEVLTAARDFPVVDPHAAAEDPDEVLNLQSGVFRTRPESLASPAALAVLLTKATRHRQRLARDLASKPVTAAAMRCATPDQLAAAERRLRESIFKPTDGVLGRFNRRMSIPISVALIRWTRFNAHLMTSILIVMGVYAGWLFSLGSYTTGVLAALVSLAASILDGCDGELARLQYKESKFGCWLDTLGDYTYYLAVFTGLTVGVVRQTGWAGYWWIGAAVLFGSLATFGLLIVLRGRITDGRPERLRAAANEHFHATGTWARLLKELSTVATRATMPYGILALAVLDLLPVVLVLAAIGAQIYWLSLAFEFRRLVGSTIQTVQLKADATQANS